MAERAALLRAEQLARWWRESVCETFLKKGSNLELQAAVAGSGHYDLLGNDGEWSASLACSYCTGNDPSETAQFMVGCDTCERWYHGPCVSMSKAAADSADTYLCPECAKLANLPYTFGPPVPAAKRTRRPRLRLVSTLLDEADEIGVEMPEVALIKELQAQAITWQERAKEAQVRAGEAGTPLDAVTLEALLVEGDACEVEPESLAPLRLTLVRKLAMYEERASVFEQALRRPSPLPLASSAKMRARFAHSFTTQCLPALTLTSHPRVCTLALPQPPPPLCVAAQAAARSQGVCRQRRWRARG